MRKYHVYFICNTETHEVMYVFFWESGKEHAYLLGIKTVSDLSFDENTNTIENIHTFKMGENTSIMKFLYFRAFNHDGSLELDRKFKEELLFSDLSYYEIDAMKYIQNKQYFYVFLRELENLITKYELKEIKDLKDKVDMDFVKNFFISVSKNSFVTDIKVAVFLNKENKKCFYTTDANLENWNEISSDIFTESENIDDMSDFDLSCTIKRKLMSMGLTISKTDDFLIFTSEHEPIHYKEVYDKVIKGFLNFSTSKTV